MADQQAKIAEVSRKIKEAQQSGDVNRMRQALLDAGAAGADPKYVQESLAQLDRLIADAAQDGLQAPAQPATAPSPLQSVLLAATAQKEKGNALLKTAKTKTAQKEVIDEYAKGLRHIEGARPKLREPNRAPRPGPIPDELKTVASQLYGNKAHVELLRGDYTAAVDDARKALAEDPKMIKCYWRAARASLLNDLYVQCLDFCDQGLKVDASNADLVALRKLALSKQEKQTESRARDDASLEARRRREQLSPQEVIELQTELFDLQEKIEKASAEVQVFTVQKRRALLMGTLIDELPADTPLYQCIGRAFLKDSREDTKKRLQGDVSQAETMLPKAEALRSELLRRKTRTENELRGVANE